jgi:hypothetical protein
VFVKVLLIKIVKLYDIHTIIYIFKKGDRYTD